LAKTQKAKYIYEVSAKIKKIFEINKKRSEMIIEVLLPKMPIYFARRGKSKMYKTLTTTNNPTEKYNESFLIEYRYAMPKVLISVKTKKKMLLAMVK